MRVAVIGAGTMGSGIAQAFAQAGEDYQVRLCDVRLELAVNGRSGIASRLQGRVDKGALGADEAAATLERIQPSEVADAADADLVVEAAIEAVEVKRSIFATLDPLCQASTLFATNTSSLSITEIARGLGRPVVGMHFFNPAPVMRLVEVVAGADTPAETVQAVVSIAEAIGKTPVRVNEAPGFVVNRILIPMINEAVDVLASGVASADDIDAAMRLGANHPMGPLALGDLVGLDVVLAIMETLQSETGDDKYRPHLLLRKYVRAGWLGRKTGRGFHDYSARS